MPKRNGFFSPLRDVFPGLNVKNINGIPGGCYQLTFSCHLRYEEVLKNHFKQFSLKMTPFGNSNQMNVSLQVLNEKKEKEFLPAMTAFIIAYREVSRPRGDSGLTTFVMVQQLLQASEKADENRANPPEIEVTPATPSPVGAETGKEEEELGGSIVMVDEEEGDWETLTAKEISEAAKAAAPGFLQRK